VFNLKWTVN